MDKVAIYCRLSKEDQDKIDKGDESGSIQNQKILLVDYANNHGMQIYKIYSDDDYTGSDLNRPSWNQMLKDAEKGLFNIILCKTQSRFARSSAVVENYIHGVFIEWGIRFISIIDNIDTKVVSTKKASQITGLVDQWYLEDLSQNIKDVFRAKMEKGEFLGSFAPYGYMKDPNDRHKLIIDEEAANVVRLIFNLNLSGYGVNVISQKLAEMNIQTPTEYKNSKGLNFCNPNGGIYAKNGYWGFTTIKRILNNPVYIGTLIQGREKKVSYKSNKVIIAPKDEWVIIENNHEPIISKEDFNRTQELLKIRRKTCKSTAGKYFQPHLFSGRIKCADCKSTMTKTSGRLAGGHDYFWCQLSKKSKGEKCTRHSIRYDRLEEHIDFKIKEMIKETISIKNNQEKLRKYFNRSSSNDVKIANIKNQIQKNNIKIEDMNSSITSLYVDKVKGIITENDFINIKNNIVAQIEEITNKNNSLNNELKELLINQNKIDSFSYALDKYVNYNKLTHEIICDFIECIYVHEQNEEGIINIDIAWNI